MSEVINIDNLNEEEILDLDTIKTAVYHAVSQYAYRGVLNEKLDDIPYEIIKGQKPRFKCCVYREREIISQRLILLCEKNHTVEEKLNRTRTVVKDTELDPSQVVHVLPSACELCPIDRITVTGNCQNCLAQRCHKSCKFDAITITSNGAVIDKKKCVNCGACVKACQYHAIVDIERPCKTACPVSALKIDEDDIASIDESKCINCGACVVGCPFGAITETSMISRVIRNIVEGKNVYAIVAPSIEGQFGDVSIKELKEAIKELGFKDVYEAALGADAVAYKEAEELLENIEEGKVMTTSCCPSFVNLVDKHFPELKDNVSTTVSPMIAAARYSKKKDPEAVNVFIGPCITKKYEAKKYYRDEVEYVLTFEELFALFQSKEVKLKEGTNENEVATSFGKGFAKSGGVTSAVLKVLDEKNLDTKVNAVKCNGIAECKKNLMLLKAGKFQGDFIEGMACEGGCVNGPAKVKDLRHTAKIFDKFHKENTNTEIIETSDNNDFPQINIHKH